MDLGRVGIWTRELDPLPTSQAQEIGGELEALGWPTLWLPEAGDRDALTHATLPASFSDGFSARRRRGEQL